MDRYSVIFLIYGILAYVLGIACSKKDFFSINFLKKSWPDLSYFLFVTLILWWIVKTFWNVDSQNTVQILIFSVTAAALIYQGFLSRLFRTHVDRPIITVKFDDSRSEYFHRTLMRIYTEILVRQDTSTNVVPLIDFVPAYYVRLKIFNDGNTTLENTEVIIENVKPLEETQLLRPFMPLNLHWAFAEEKERRKINVPPNNAYRIVDFFELMNPLAVSVYASRLVSGNVDYERYNALKTGFRVCSVPPNTLSDIFEKGSYVFTIGIYSNNTKPAYRDLLVEYDGSWDDNSDAMRRSHLKVKLLD